MNPSTKRLPWAFLVPLAALGLGLTGCSPPVEPEPDPELVATSIVMESDRVEVDDGAEVSVTAQVLDQNGTPLSPQPGLTWTSSDQAVASVTTAGLVRGEFPGEAVIAASLGELRAEAGVTVRPFATEVERVSGDEQRAAGGATLAEPIVVRVLDRHGNPVAGAEVAFVVSAGGGSVSPSLASVDEHGEARAEWTLGTSSEINRVVASLVEGAAAGADFSATVVTAESVPESGGEVETSGGEVKLSFPANALPAETEVSVEPAEPVQEAPANATRIEGTAYHFQPSGITFSEPVQIQISYAGVELPAGVSQADLRIFRESDTGWQLVGTSQPDPNDQVVRAEIHGFSTYSIMAVSASSVTVQVSAPEAHVDRLRLTVTASDILTPIETDLTLDGTGASTSVEVPAGSDRTFTVRALDGGGTTTHRGEALADVVAGEDLDLTVGLEALQARVSVQTGFPGEHVRQVQVIVTGPGIGSPIEAELVIDGSQASASVQVPAGSDRTFTVHARDAGQIETHRGAANAKVVGGADPSVAVELAALTQPVGVRVPVPGDHTRQLRVAVTGPGIDAPIESDLAIDTTIASGSVEVPAGSERTVTVRAYDEGGTLTHRGETTVNVVAGEPIDLSIALEGLDGSVTVAIGVEGYTLSIETGGSTLAVGATRQFIATVRDSSGDAIEDAQFTWASANPALAKVDAEGNVTAVREGDTRISVNYNGFAASAPLTIEP